MEGIIPDDAVLVLPDGSIGFKVPPWSDFHASDHHGTLQTYGHGHDNWNVNHPLAKISDAEFQMFVELCGDEKPIIREAAKAE